MTAVLASSKSQGSTKNMRFRFADTNPITGRTYQASRFDDLPYLISLVVENHLGITARHWDALIRSREVAEHVDCFRLRNIPWTLDRPPVAAPVGDGPKGKCEDCWGTCVQIDIDGSLSGVVGASTLCICSQRRSGRPGR